MTCSCACHRPPGRRVQVSPARQLPNPCLLCARGGLCGVALAIRELDAAGVASADFARFVKGTRQ